MATRRKGAPSSGEVVMPTFVLTRRDALLSFGAFAAAGLAGCNTTPIPGVQPSAATSGLSVGAIEVDTTPLVAYVGNPTAGWAQQALPAALAQVLASGAPGGPPLHVRIDTLYLGGGGPADPDRMRGVATLGGRTISVRANSTYFSSPTDQALPEQALQGRVQALAVVFAYRLKRRLGA
jgi:hypothetical protein